MAAFAYSAINALGVESTGELTAQDLGAAREQLRARGLRPVTLDELRAEAASTGRRKKVKTR